MSTEVLQFMSGILSKEKDNNFMEWLLELISKRFGSGPSTLIDIDQDIGYLLMAKCLAEYEDQEFAKSIVKKRYREFSGKISFSRLTDVDCIAVSFLLDVISAVNAEEGSGRSQTISELQSHLVRTLKIQKSHLTRYGVERILKSLKKEFCAITKLYLRDCISNDQSADKIGEFLPLTKVTDLILFHDQISDAGIVSLCQALQTATCKVTTLDLWGNNQITDVGVVSLCQALQTPTCNITTLKLSGNQIIDAGVVSLCQVLQTPTCKVTTLYLSDNQITDACVVSLCQVLQAPACKVTTLGLSRSQITDAGVVSLCQALQTPTCKVTTLDLRGNQITDAGVVSLCQALQTPTCKVTTLHLSWNQITDAGVVSLCRALQTATCKVTTLHLGWNQITDAGVVSLCQVLQTATCKVTTLDLSDNHQMTYFGKECLRNLLKLKPDLNLGY